MKRIIAEDESTGLFQYFIRVIPTIYTNEYGHQVFTNQYTITDRFRPLNMPQANGDTKVSLRCLLLLFFFISAACSERQYPLSSPLFFLFMLTLFSIFDVLFLAPGSDSAWNLLRVRAVPVHD